MKSCWKCGNQIEDDSIMLCPVCGEELADPQSRVPFLPQEILPVDYSSSQPMGIPYPSQETTSPAGPYSQPFHGFKGPNSRKYVTATILMVIGMVLLIVTLAIPWYTWRYEIENKDEDKSAEIVLNEDLFGGEFVGTTKEDGEAVDEYKEKGDWSDEDDKVSDLYTNLSYIMIVSIILGAVGFVMVLVSGGSQTFKKSYNNAGFYLGLSAALLALLSVIVLMVALPLAHDATLGEEIEEEDEDALFSEGPWDSFWGSDSGDKEIHGNDIAYSTNWRPSFGWFIAMIGGVLYIAGGVIIYSAGKADQQYGFQEEAAPIPPATQMIAQGGQPLQNVEQYQGFQPQYYGSSPQPTTGEQEFSSYDPASFAPKPLIPDQYWQCPNCGSQVSLDYTFCNQCGTKRE